MLHCILLEADGMPAGPKFVTGKLPTDERPQMLSRQRDMAQWKETYHVILTDDNEINFGLFVHKRNQRERFMFTWKLIHLERLHSQRFHRSNRMVILAIE